MYSYTNRKQGVGLVLWAVQREQLVGKFPSLPAPSPRSAHTGGCSASLAIVDGLNEFHCRGELHPPIALLPTQPAGVEIIDVLNGGQQAGRVCLEGGRGGGGPTLTTERTARKAMYNTYRM